MKKSILGLLTLLLVCSCSEKKESKVKAPTRVKTEVVGEATINPQQQYVGIVEEHEGTAVSFTGMGVVKRMLLNEGQAVSRGQLIAEMDDTQARNLLSGACAIAVVASSKSSKSLKFFFMIVFVEFPS